MNLKKISILLFGLIFLISTTSLPLTLHMCKMAEKRSSEQCEKCIKEIQKPVSSSTNIKNLGSSTCCSKQLIDSSVKDNFISSKVNLYDVKNMQLSVSFILAQEVLNKNPKLIWSGEINSPPNLIQNPIYIINSVFLI